MYQGGLLLAILFAFLYMRHTGLPGLATADVFAPGLAIGSRYRPDGCLMAGCCWGSDMPPPVGHHVYESRCARTDGSAVGGAAAPGSTLRIMAELIIFAFLYKRFHRLHRHGDIIGWYLVLYSSVRFLVEFFRNHEQDLVAGLSLTQWISLGTLLAGALLLLRPRTAPAVA